MVATDSEPQAILPEGDSTIQAYLRVMAGPDAGRNIELTEGATLTIGRSEKSDTHLGRGDWPEFVNAPIPDAESRAIRRDRHDVAESWVRSRPPHRWVSGRLSERTTPLLSPLR